jgi:phosphonate transport system ATP-binding protein
VILADEPVSALDPAAADRVMSLLRDLAHGDGLGVAAVLHQPELARRYADRVVGMANAQVCFDVPAEEVDLLAVGALYAAVGAP